MEVKELFKQHSEAVEARLDALDQKTATLIEWGDGMEQKLACRALGGGDSGDLSWGEQFVQSEGLKAFAADHSTRPARVRMEVKTTITSSAASGGPLGAQPFRDDAVPIPRRTSRVRDLLPSVGITTGSVEFPKQTTRTNNANVVAEGALKPESEYAFQMQSATARVIAHWVPASVQILEDAPQLAGIIDTELSYGLQLREDNQLLYGSGTGENLNGLVTNATAYTAPFDPAGTETMIDIIALALLQLTNSDFVGTGIVMHPSDWMRIRLLKDADGKYLLGEPGAQVAPRLFGLPVSPTPAMTIDKFLVGDFNAAATLYDRWEPRIEVSTEHADFFTRNLVAIRAEERIALAVKQAGALIYGDFGNVA